MDIGLACHLPPGVPNTWLDPNGASVEEDVPMETGESVNGAARNYCIGVKDMP